MTPSLQYSTMFAGSKDHQTIQKSYQCLLGEEINRLELPARSIKFSFPQNSVLGLSMSLLVTITDSMEWLRLDTSLRPV